MHVHRHPLNDQLRDESAGKTDPPINSAIDHHLGVITPAKPNTESLTTPMAMRDRESVAITAVPSRPVASSSDSRTTPEPLVPPTTRPQPAAADGKTFSPRR